MITNTTSVTELADANFAKTTTPTVYQVRVFATHWKNSAGTLLSTSPLTANVPGSNMFTINNSLDSGDYISM